MSDLLPATMAQGLVLRAQAVLDAVRAEHLCHQAILVNDASSPVLPPDADVVPVGDVIW